MTAALALVPNDVTTAAGPGTLDVEAARRLTDRIRGALVLAHGLLGDAYAGRAHVALGYGTGAAGWGAYCAAEFTAEGMVRLPRDQRASVVAQLRERGMSARAIAAGLGIGEATVRRDLPTAPDDADALPAVVTSLDGRHRPATAIRGRRPALTSATTTERVLAALLAAGPEGLTWAELGHRLRLHHGQTSGTLSRLHRRGRAVRTTTYRAGSAVYRHPQHQGCG